MKILIIGGGNMGLTYAKSLIRAHLTTETDLMILERSEEKAAELSTQRVGTIYREAADCLPLADLVILAVKPQDSGALFPRCGPACIRSRSS